ncbi:MAG: peptide ABC transporter substrate-binding protein, partial [Pseudomonadota bacterium]
MIRKEINWGAIASLFTVVAISLIAACKPADPETTNVLERGNGGHPGSLDPLLAEDVHAFRILADLYEGLVVVGPDGQLQPGVAKRWQVSDDGLVWRFELRSDARWSDGKAVTADDFVRTFQQLASGATDSPYEFLLQPIVNFEAVNAGKAQTTSLGVEASGDRKLEFRLSAPTPHWLSVLSTAIAMPTREASESVFNGAYKLVDVKVNDNVRLVRNPNYWDAENVAIDEVVYYSIVNPTTEYNLYNTDGLHITATVPVDLMQTLPERHGSELRIAPTLGLYYVAFDLTEKPFNNVVIRKALTMAIDRSQLVQLLGRGERPAFGVVPAGIPGYTSARY